MEDELTKFEKIKQHLKENKKTYLIGGIAGAGCFTAGFLLRPQVVNVVDAFNFKYKSPTTTTVITVLERRACKEPIPIRCVDTGEVFGSIRRAGDVLDIPRQLISDQIRGKIPSANGFRFEAVA
jgi:hypothetical protein